MKLRENTTLTRPRIFDGGYEHPWYEYQKQELINLEQILLRQRQAVTARRRMGRMRF